MDDVEWTGSDRKHVTSSLACHRLPAYGGGGDGEDLQLMVALKAFDGAVQYRRRLTVPRRPWSTYGDELRRLDWSTPTEAASGRSCAGERRAHAHDINAAVPAPPLPVPPSPPPLVRRANVGADVEINFSVRVLRIIALGGGADRKGVGTAASLSPPVEVLVGWVCGPSATVVIRPRSLSQYPTTVAEIERKNAGGDVDILCDWRRSINLETSSSSSITTTTTMSSDYEVENDVIVSRSATLSDDGTSVRHDVCIRVAAVRPEHAGRFTATFTLPDAATSDSFSVVDRDLDSSTAAAAAGGGGRRSNETTIELSVDLIVVDKKSSASTLLAGGNNVVAAGVDSDAILARTATAADSGIRRMRVRSCSNATWTSVVRRRPAPTPPPSPPREFHFRPGLPDCVYCQAMGAGWPVPRVELYRDDGLILGTEETHSVYRYQDSLLSAVAVFLVRQPFDVYTGEYVCLAGPGVRGNQIDLGSVMKPLSLSIDDDDVDAISFRITVE